MESTPHWSPRASSDTVSCSFSYHTWQFIIFTFSTITACIISYSFRISFRTQDLALQQILSPIDLFLFYRTDYTDSRTMLNGCTDKCVRLSRPLVGFWTHFKSPHFHFISFHFSSVGACSMLAVQQQKKLCQTVANLSTCPRHDEVNVTR